MSTTISYYRRFAHFSPNLLKTLDRDFAKLATSTSQSIEYKGLIEMTEPRVIKSILTDWVALSLEVGRKYARPDS